MTADEVARVVAVGGSEEGTCSVIAVRRRGGIVDLYLHGSAHRHAWLPAAEWRRLVALPEAA